MKIKIPHRDFQYKELEVNLEGLFFKTTLLLNANPVTPYKRNKYTLKNDQGSDIEIQTKRTFPDPVPTLIIGNEKIQILPKFNMADIVLTVLPIGLIPVGGAIGGGLGALAISINGAILRHYWHNKPLSYMLTLMVTASSVMLLILISALLLPLFK